MLVHYGSREAEANAVVREIADSGGEAQAIGADLSTLEGIHALFAAVDGVLRTRQEDHRLDILVNNAGIGQILTLEETTEASYEEVMRINVKAPLFV
ncbi:putative short-chain dehydrogenase, partial [Paenibacillus sp. 598K]